MLQEETTWSISMFLRRMAEEVLLVVSCPRANDYY